MLVTMGEGSGTPTDPHHTPSSEAQQTSPAATSSQSLPPVTTATIPTVIPTDIPQLRQYTRRARIAQSSALPPVADEPVSPIEDNSQGEACPTDFGLEAEHDRANITKTSTLPNDSAPRVTSLATDEGRLSIWRTEMEEMMTHLEKIPQSRGRASVLSSGVQVSVPPAAEVATVSVHLATISVPAGSDVVPTASPIFTTATVTIPYSRRKEDATIKGRRLEKGEEAAIERSTEKGSDDTEEMVNVLTSLDAVSVLSSGVQVSVPPATEVATASIPPAGEIHPISVPTGSGVVPTASLIFTTATVATLYIRRKEEQLAREDQRRDEQITRDAEIARIHVEEELQMMVKTSEEISEEDLKEMMHLVPVEEVYVEALQVKHPIINWEIHTEGQRSYWKFIRLGGSTTSYQFFVDMLKHFDREDLNQLCALVKETLNIRQATSNKEKELWVELKRLYEPDVEDQLWTQTRALMHDLVE
nr:hypothetical protein [Tanacetum cinerariifolium]